MNHFFVNNKPKEADYPEIKQFYDNFDVVKQEYFAYKKDFFEQFRTSDILEKYKVKNMAKEAKTEIKTVILKSSASYEDNTLYTPEVIDLHKKYFKETIKLTSDTSITNIVYGYFFPFFNSGYHTDGPEVNLCFFRMSEANRSTLNIVAPKYNDNIILKNSGDYYFFYTYTPHCGTVMGPDGIDCCSIAFNV